MLKKDFPSGTCVIEKDGAKSWRRAGKLHRDDGPAVERKNGDRVWYRDGSIHRAGGPAVENADGVQKWYRDGKIHRDGGPAIVYGGGWEEWYQDGVQHRADGPAITHPDGRCNQWWLDGERVTKDAVMQRIESVICGGTRESILIRTPMHLRRRTSFFQLRPGRASDMR